jgi:hypothetical protein
MRRFASKREPHGTVYGKGQELAPAIMAIIRINSSTVKKNTDPMEIVQK